MERNLCGEKLPLGVVPALTQATANNYPDIATNITEKDWNDAYIDMMQGAALFHDPKGIKRVLTFGKIAPLVYKKRVVPLDYLNEAHTIWNCPTSLEETYTHSVWDLWNIAMADGKSSFKRQFKFYFEVHLPTYRPLLPF